MYVECCPRRQALRDATHRTPDQSNRSESSKSYKSPPKQNMSHELANLFSPLKKLFPGRSFVSPQSILLFAKPLAGASAQWQPHHFLARTTGHGWLNGSFERVESIKYEAVYSLFAILTWCSFLVDRKPLISLSSRRYRRIYSRYM